MALPKVKRNPPYIESTLKLFFLFGIKFRFTKNGVEDFRGVFVSHLSRTQLKSTKGPVGILSEE